jgi:NAD(P)-dependent dehydrogenase (short-subunit alcohol dehydrogenase family)
LPEHVGDAAVFLASEAAAFISGADLVVDGAALAEGVGLYKKLGF